MSVSAAHMEAFYTEILRDRLVWGIRDEGGFPAPMINNARAMPFWSKRTRAQRVIENVPAYRGFEPLAFPLDEWRSRWLPGLEADGMLVGLNWSGSRATGYDVPAADVEQAFRARESA